VLVVVRRVEHDLGAWLRGDVTGRNGLGHLAVSELEQEKAKESARPRMVADFVEAIGFVVER
jgi:hypothetical protein